MNTEELINFFNNSKCILGEGAVIERLKRDTDFELDPFIVNSAFIYDDKKRTALDRIYRQYMDIAAEYDLPVIMSTPTWRASEQRIKEAGYESKDVNADNYRFLDFLRQSYGPFSSKILICGLMSCKEDAYKPEEALSIEEASEFHQWQAERLSNAGVDFTLAATLPALSEAKGLAHALSKTDTPYVISFVARPEGTMLDGTPLKQAVAEIDAEVNPKPAAFMLNCTHAAFAKSALMSETNSSDMVRKRMAGLFANTAALSPEDLNNSVELVEQEPEDFGRSVADLAVTPGLKMVGGCCGTDDRHIKALASHLKELKD